jgi:hypothetical protein
MSPNKQLQRTVIRRRGRRYTAPHPFPHVKSAAVAMLVVMALVSSGRCFSQQALEAGALMQEIATNGPRDVVTALYDDDAKWDELLDHVANGNEEWLRAAVALRPGTDAGATNMLTLSVGEALEHSPAQVLRIAAAAFGFDLVCGAPDADDDRYNSLESSLRAIELRMRKLSQLADPALKVDRDECTQHLEASKAAVVDFFDVD